MRDKATLIAVSGVVALGVGVLAVSWKTGALDTELLKMIVSNLMSFAGGAGIIAVTNSESK